MNLPDFSFERQAHKKGYNVVAGVDEVGRGSFAGPVVAGVVAFKDGVLPLGSPKSIPPANKLGAPYLGPPASRHPSIIINDSKRLNAKQRELASFWVKRNALACGIGKASVGQINKFGIKKASEIAFRKAIKNCGIEINYILIDAFYVPYVRGLRRKNQKPIIKGDTKSISIAAASIIAKVYRDKLMTKLSNNRKYKKYGWDKNKGYGTLIHRNAIQKYGLTRLHRKKFVESYFNNSSFSQAR